MRPTSVVVLGQRYEVTFVALDDPLLSDGKKVGRTRHLHQRIAIAEGQAADQERDTVLHEVLHVVTGIQGIVKDDEDDERIVAMIVPVLLDALRRNPELVAYLTADA